MRDGEIDNRWRSVGRAIQKARRTYKQPGSGKTLSQTDFYFAVSELEKAWRPNPRQRVYIKVSDDWAKKRIGDIEAGRIPVSRFDLELFAVVLGQAKTAFYPLLQEDDAGMGDESGATTAMPSAPPVARRERGFRRIAPNSLIPSSREPTQACITDACRKSGPFLIVLEGRTGVGKSFFLSHWFAHHGAGLFGGDALMLDASKISAQEILPALAEHLGIAAAGQGPAYIAETIATLPAYLLIIDGLRASALLGRARPNAVSLAGLREGLFEVLRLAPNLKVILCVENNGHVMEQHFLNHLSDHVGAEHFLLRPLVSSEGAAFMASFLTKPVSHEHLRQISDHLQGMPLALRVAAAELDRLSDLERERYAVHRAVNLEDAESEDGYEQFRDLVLSYLARLEADRGAADGRQTASVHALLRLLALMPGPTTIAHLAHLLDGGRIRRLETMTADDPRLLQVPFLIRLDGKLDVHALVRRILRNELEGFVRNNNFDGFTSVRELQWIHWRSALLHWTIIKRVDQSRDADGLTTSVIEAFVYHIVQLIRLTPKAQQRSRNTGGLSPQIIADFEKDFRRISNVALWDIAYYRVVQPFLLKSYGSTRNHGQFDVKTRVLENLVRTVDFGLPIAPLVLTEIHKEIAVCLMHGGYINAARHEAERANSALRRVPTTPGNKDAIWRSKMEIESVIATVDIRQGRIAGAIADRLEPFVGEAEARLRGPVAGLDSEHAPPGLAGALRVFARLADVELQQGKVAEALTGFARADDLQLMLRKRNLDGEAARRYVTALVRSRSESSGRLDKAQRLVAANLDYYRSRLSETNTSSDLIPFMIQEISLARVGGDLAEARRLLQVLREEEHVLRGAYTFSTGAEMEIEELRLRCVEAYDACSTPWATDDVAEEAGALAQRLADSHHALLAFEASLLRLEAMPPGSRDPGLRPLGDQMRLSGWHLRMEDIAELRHGRSAILRFGL